MKTKFLFHLLRKLILLGVVGLMISCSGDAFVESNELNSISGTIIFDNVAMWPDSGEVEVTIWPQGVWTANGPIGPPQNANQPLVISRNLSTNQYNYIFTDLPDGEYSAIAVGWRHPDESLPAEQRSAVLGVYLQDENAISTGLDISFPGSPFQGPVPATITVNNEDKTQVDFRADFAFIEFFFPPPGTNE